MALSLMTSVLLPLREKAAGAAGRVRRGAPFAAATAACLALAGCGFQPLYGDHAVVADLSKVDVVAPQGRAGFLLRQHLDDELARNRDAPAAYRMDLVVHETRVPRGVRVDNTATRYEFTLFASYVLTAIPSGAVAKRGSVHVEVTYDSADQPYQAIAAEQDAEERATQEAARRIQLELASWLVTGEPKMTPVVKPL
jgi:LPS-assembly lipoprotein